MKRIILIGFVTIVLLACLGSLVVWPPDVISGREVTVARVAIRDGEYIQLSQTWVGDGYLTQIRHGFPSGIVFQTVGDPDSRKAWAARIQINTNAAFARIRFNRKDWRYYYNSQSLILNKSGPTGDAK